MKLNPEKIENNLTFLGLFGMIDPLKNGVVKSIEICKNAGIEVIMCTGDNLDTAKAIAINAGILPHDFL